MNDEYKVRFRKDNFEVYLIPPINSNDRAIFVFRNSKEKQTNLIERTCKYVHELQNYMNEFEIS